MTEMNVVEKNKQNAEKKSKFQWKAAQGLGDTRGRCAPCVGIRTGQQQAKFFTPAVMKRS